MRLHFPLAIQVIFFLAAGVRAQNVSRLYPRAQLEADAARYREQVSAEYRETILPKFTSAEKAALAGVEIQFPLTGPKDDPFEFYTDGKTVHLPALSLRFYSDLCLANAWLNAHGYDATTVSDYVGLLFREASLSPTAPLPPVFKTLGIPSNVRDEPAVAERASRNFGNTVVFLLAHELGHVLKAHRADAATPAQRRAQEIEADQFAVETMRRLPQIPLGLEQWFNCERIRHAAPTRFPSDADWQKYLSGLSHPVTTERLEALAAEIEKAPEDFARLQENRALWTVRSKMFAQYFRLAAPFAGNSVARVAEYSRVRDLRLSALKPRKAAFVAPGTTVGEEELDFQGFYSARRTPADGKEPNEFDLLLLRNGDEVTGQYVSRLLQGSIDGKVEGNVLHFTWTEGETKGRGRLKSEGESLAGTWGSGEREEGVGAWGAVRRKPEKTK